MNSGHECCAFHSHDPDGHTIGNQNIRITVAINENSKPYLSNIEFRTTKSKWNRWACSSEMVLFPSIVQEKTACKIDSEEVEFSGIEYDTQKKALVLRYLLQNRCVIYFCIKPAADLAAFATWTCLENISGHEIKDVSRFDALHIELGGFEHAPQSAYLLGWLPGVRMDAPGRHAVLVNSQSSQHPSMYNILDYLPQNQFKPEAGWTFSKLRLIRERLTSLPLRSGRRSTYQNYPWVAVNDTRNGRGFYAGFEWSGKWGMDIAYCCVRQQVMLSAYTDGYSHNLASGGQIESPKAFIGFYEGDWDDAFNSSAAYAKAEIIPRPPENFPRLHWSVGFGSLQTASGKELYEHADAAAQAGFEAILVDAGWWRDSPRGGEFSNGLGDFRDNAGKVAGGLKALSEHLHALNLQFGLWFEFERVDIRTAMKGKHPWKPEWIVHQDGYPCRSWCQNVYSLCLGVRAAAQWALDNISHAIREYGVDWIMIDSNSWKPCNDPSHDHGPGDGEWAQINGLYYVLEGIRKRFPHITIMNCAGGAQRGDYGLARYCDMLACDDLNEPSAVNRQYAYGIGCMYPSYYGIQAQVRYHSDTVAEDGHSLDIPPDVFEWRALNRIVGFYQPVYNHRDINAANMEIMKKIVSTAKEIRRSFHGERFTHAGPGTYTEPGMDEHDHWEVYEYAAPEKDLVSVVLYRCKCPDAEFLIRFKGVDPSARYMLTSYSGSYNGIFQGSELTERGFLLHFDRMKHADILILKKIQT